MKIAVTYDNGNIFQHFGKTKSFKIFEVNDKQIVSREIIDSNGSGHGALADLLADHSIDVLICGGIGGGAQQALKDAGIELCAGASGNADKAVEAYLAGELVNSGANCDHHHDEHHDCHHHEDNCSHHSCGHCGGHTVPGIEGPNVGKKVRVHYKGTLNDGSQFDSSYDRGEPLEFVCGAGMMIRGFDTAVATMKVGEIKTAHLEPKDAYGEIDPDAVMTVKIAEVPGAEDLKKGQRVYLTNQMGQPFPVTVTEKTDTEITFDANHELAGKELNFEIELVEIL